MRWIARITVAGLVTAAAGASLAQDLPTRVGRVRAQAARYGEDDFYVGTCYPGEERLPAVPPEHGPWTLSR